MFSYTEKITPLKQQLSPGVSIIATHEKNYLNLHRKSANRPKAKTAVKSVRKAGVDLRVLVPFNKKEKLRVVHEALANGVERIIAGCGAEITATTPIELKRALGGGAYALMGLVKPARPSPYLRRKIHFSLLSLFPLILGLVAMAGTVLKSEQLRNRVIDRVNEFFPVGSENITQNIESLVHLRGAAGLTGILVLFWSASKMVGAISRGINRALDLERGHAFYLSPLRNYVLVMAISVLMFSTMAVSPFADLLSGLDLSFLGSRANEFIDLVGGQLASLLATGIMADDIIAGLYTLAILHAVQLTSAANSKTAN